MKPTELAQGLKSFWVDLGSVMGGAMKYVAREEARQVLNEIDFR